MNSFSESNATVSFNFVKVAQVLWERKYTIALGGAAGMAVAVGVSLCLTPRYQAVGNLLVRSDALTAPDTDRAFASAAVNEAVVATEEDVLLSDGLLRRVANNLDIPAAELLSTRQRLRLWLPRQVVPYFDRMFPSDAPTQESIIEQRIIFLRQAVAIIPTKDSSLITVRAVTHSAQLSAATVNDILQNYMQERTDQESIAAESIETSLRERLKQTRQQIDRGETQLTEIMQQPGAIENSEIPGLMQRMTLIGSKLTEATAELAARESNYLAAMQLRDGGGGDTVARLRSELALLTAKSAGAMSTGGAGYLRGQLAQIHALQAELDAEVKRSLEKLRAGVEAQRATVNALRDQAEHERADRLKQIGTSITYNGMRETVASLWRTSDMLNTRLIDLAAHSISLNVHILGLASPPTLPSFPNKMLFGVTGCLIGSLLASFASLFGAHTLKRHQLALQLTMQAPLLGGVPEVGQQSGQRRLVASAVAQRDADGLSDTLYGTAIALEHAVKDGELGSIAITSAHSGEGKTTVSIALSRSLAKMHMRVLLIDLDLHKPSVERVISESITGLENKQISLVSRTVDVRVDPQSGLHILTPFYRDFTDPRGFLRSEGLRQLIAEFGQQYDLIVFDTPPVLSVPDAVLITKLAGGAVLVAEQGRCTEAEAIEVHRRLAGTKRQICGIILTKVTGTKGLAGIYTGYNHNGFYSE